MARKSRSSAEQASPKPGETWAVKHLLDPETPGITPEIRTVIIDKLTSDGVSFTFDDNGRASKCSVTTFLRTYVRRH
jgi:hypothetical protein